MTMDTGDDMEPLSSPLDGFLGLGKPPEKAASSRSPTLVSKASLIPTNSLEYSLTCTPDKIVNDDRNHQC